MPQKNLFTERQKRTMTTTDHGGVALAASQVYACLGSVQLDAYALALRY